MNQPNQWIKITNVHRTSPELIKMTPGSIHKIIKPPSYALMKITWVQGVSHPVRLLKGEYLFINQNPKTMLSDKLLEIGRGANKRNNRSQAIATNKMFNLLTDEQANFPEKTLFNITKHVIRILNKEGFSYYKAELFFNEN